MAGVADYFRSKNLYNQGWAVKGYRGGRRLAARVGFDVVLKTFYSPVPDLKALPSGTFERKSSLTGIDFDLDRQMAWVEQLETKDFKPAPPGTEHAYTEDVESYGWLDAALLHGVIRTLQPKRVVELGSGASSLVIAAAGSANPTPPRYDAYDPYPGVAQDDLPGLTSLNRIAAQAVPLTVFDALDDGDVLFVDTTHTVKLGSEVNRIVLDILPRLKPGVVVHFHDIFLPYEYPREWLEDFGLFWNEQYLLQAFLTHNAEWEVLGAASALWQDRREQLTAVLPNAEGGGAFWIRRRRRAA